MQHVGKVQSLSSPVLLLWSLNGETGQETGQDRRRFLLQLTALGSSAFPVLDLVEARHERAGYLLRKRKRGTEHGSRTRLPP